MHVHKIYMEIDEKSTAGMIYTLEVTFYCSFLMCGKDGAFSNAFGKIIVVNNRGREF